MRFLSEANSIDIHRNIRCNVDSHGNSRDPAINCFVLSLSHTCDNTLCHGLGMISMGSQATLDEQTVVGPVAVKYVVPGSMFWHSQALVNAEAISFPSML